jgi:hypothetical protein
MISPIPVRSGLGYEDVEPAEAKEWEQHSEMLEQLIKDEELETKKREEDEMRLEMEEEDYLSQATQELSVNSKEHHHNAKEEEETEKVHLT